MPKTEGATSYITDEKPDKDESVKECTVTALKMHREIYEAMPEFAGF